MIDLKAELQRLDKAVEEGGHYGFKQDIWKRCLERIEYLESPNETAWLVERRDPPAPRWAFFDELGSFGWTTNANDALRFSRKIDAERFCGDMTADVVVCEHMWCTPPSEPERQS